MRILIQTFGSAGDVHPYVGLGRALKERGHDVLLFANSLFAESVQAAGLTYVECGRVEDFAGLIENPDLWHPQKGVELIMREGVAPSLAPAYDTLQEHVRDGETLLIASTLAMSAMVLHEVEAVPLVVAHLAPMAFPSAHRMPRFVGIRVPGWTPQLVKRGLNWVIARLSDRMLAPQLNAFRARFGLVPERDLLNKWLHRGDLCLGMFPDWFGPPQPDWPDVTLTGFPLYDEGEHEPLDADLDAWLGAGEPPIVFTAGSANVFGAGFYRHSVAAAQALGRRAVLVTRNAAVLPDPLPEHARHVEYAPFTLLFERAAAVVHHGGVGTTAKCIAAGVPHVAAYMGFDQADNASRMEDLGVGAGLWMKHYTAESVGEVLGRLLSDTDVQAACERAAARVRTARPREAACDAIERMAAGRVGAG